MTGASLPDPLVVEVFAGGPDVELDLPGSKSITNRALVCAALAEGRSNLEGVLFADDTEAMMGCLRALGAGVDCEEGEARARVRGTGGAPRVEGAVLDSRLSGTTSRFIAPVAVAGGADVVVDGAPSLRARPMGDLFEALRALAVEVRPLGAPDRLPVELGTHGRGIRGGSVEMRGDISSQFVSGLLLAAPVIPGGLGLGLTSALVSRPYVDMTLAVMRSFGAVVESTHRGAHFEVAPGGYRATDMRIEPDASAASYFFALAAILGGRVRVEGLGSGSLQGDLRFVDVLERMGASVRREAYATEVAGTGELRGIEVDMSELSDTAQTLAAIAPFASSPTTVTGVGFIRGKETDRIAAVVRELRRLGVEASELPDGFEVFPGAPGSGTVQTYDDHRMAMSFAVLGSRSPGVAIADPGCVAKTFPGFWETLELVRSTAN